MPHIQKDNQPVTQITVVDCEPGKQEEVLSVMAERARFMASQPGFVSISLHRGVEGCHVVNYVQWESRDLLQTAHRSPEFRDEWRHFDELTRDIEPHLYAVALVMDGNGAQEKHARSADSRQVIRRRTPARRAAARKARAH